MVKIQYLEKNRCYTNKTAIKPGYIIVHSTGSAIGTVEKLFKSWNSVLSSKACHGMVDDLDGLLTLPLTYKGWHVGSKGNGSTIGFEICEPANIAYADLAHTKVNTAKYNPKDKAILADFNKRYRNAVEMAAYMCKETGIPSENVISHAEAYKNGLATNHADIGHWFPLFGKSMDDFRDDVKKALEPVETEKSVTVSVPVLKKGAKRAEVRTVQRLLLVMGYRDQNGAVLAVDGSFGSKTEHAVRSFQKDSGLSVDASVGPATWKALLELS